MRIAEVSTAPLGHVGCSSDPNEKCGHGLEKIYPTAVVRYGYLKYYLRGLVEFVRLLPRIMRERTLVSSETLARLRAIRRTR